MSLIPTPTLPPPFEILLIPYYITTFQPAKKELLCMNVTDDQKGYNLLRVKGCGRLQKGERQKGG